MANIVSNAVGDLIGTLKTEVAGRLFAAELFGLDKLDDGRKRRFLMRPPLDCDGLPFRTD